MTTTVRTSERSHGFFADFARSKGPAEFEEASDAIQRPLGYVIARLLQPTPISPNAVTAAAMLAAVGGGACLFVHRPGFAASLIVVAAILDSADGQLARLRQTQSLGGRMLDGAADMVGGVSVFLGVTWLLVEKYGASPLWTLSIVAACFLTALTSSFHHSMFDHYKNVWTRMTTPGAGQPDDWAAARARRALAGKVGPIAAVTWAIYLSYLKTQLDYVRRYDPWTRSRDLPAYDAERAARYRLENARARRVWTLFGFGVQLLGIALAAAFDLLEVLLIFRLIVLNAVFYGWLRNAQRRASRAALQGAA